MKKLFSSLLPRYVKNLIKNDVLGVAYFTIKPDTKCLIIAPHPDDDAIGCGGFLIKYKHHCDVVCFSSSGVQYPDSDPKTRSNMRIKEFHSVMDYLKIKNRWIFETYGKPFFIDKIQSRFQEYLETLQLNQYDYILLPHPLDDHPEHMFITNSLVKDLLRKQKSKKKLQIMFYEIWTPMSRPNYFLDISDVMPEKIKLIKMYKSEMGNIDYPKRISGLNCYRGVFTKNAKFAEAYEITTVKRYLNESKH